MTSSRYAELSDPAPFARRHIGPDARDAATMLRRLGLKSLDALVDAVVPEPIRLRAPLDLPPAQSEADVTADLTALAGQNRVATSLIGQGYHDTVTPAVIQRNVLENPAWYTAYTPYQAEISQGRLEALLTFQTLVTDLTGLEVANASLLDEATAAAEAMTLCHRATRGKRDVFYVAEDVHPQTLDVLRTRAEPLGLTVKAGPVGDFVPDEAFGLLLQYPTTTGEVGDPREAVQRAHDAGAMVVMACDLLALTLLTPPGELGADIAIGSAQRFGVPLFYGGPHAAFFATKKAHQRALPGRLVGVSIDAKGRTAYRLTLQTREQHIRREKATSNICTAQALLAIVAAMYAVYHGPEGLTYIARRTHRLAVVLAEGLKRLDFPLAHDRLFDTLCVEAGAASEAILARAYAAGINLRRIEGGRIAIALDETSTPALVERLWRIFAPSAAALDFAALDATAEDRLPAALIRRSAFLAHPTFHRYRSETEMLRYLRALSDKDLALDRAMIPLGSCTMKLNAAAEMQPVSWPEFAGIHPFAPAEQTQGYAELIRRLEADLCAITGFAAVSLQPNSGAQGEYAGLLAIRRYHRARGEDRRDVCLIPSSAHGTNPASAQMAGMRVVVVGCDAQGNIDVADLKAKVAQHAENLAALMVTYPSTHGVFETAIRDICAAVHDAGGQVYMDGANMNALVGVCQPAAFGADVCHLNLHKTFCIPHGGGGPGVGPIGVAAHLTPYLPGHSALGDASGAVAATPFGSAGILPISYAYIRMMGAEGLRAATASAILAANYLARGLQDAYPILYRGANAMVAHECILDVRPLKTSAEVSVDDIAKRLIDYGFHAPTMSWPVAGTLMIEPTESESLAELDRFVAAMRAIREEIAEIERGAWAKDDNPLVHAPHTAEDALAEDWPRPYARALGVYPVGVEPARKFWPPVARIDNVHGDRHVVCTCPPLDSYQQAAAE